MFGRKRRLKAQIASLEAALEECFRDREELLNSKVSGSGNWERWLNNMVADSDFDAREDPLQ